jgi:hypothetical protein
VALTARQWTEEEIDKLRRLRVSPVLLNRADQVCSLFEKVFLTLGYPLIPRA